MKTHIYKYLSLSILMSGLSLHAADPSTPVANKFTIRSQGANALRRDIQTTGKQQIYDAQDIYGNFSLTTEYTRSIRASHIARSLFGDSLCGGRYLKIQGSRVADRDSSALLADYFYLPTDYNSLVEVRPEIQNFIADINMYFGLDNWATGLYAWIQAPVSWTKWNLHMTENILAPGVNPHDEGYFAVGSISRDALQASFMDYAQGVPLHDPSNGMVNGVLTQTDSKANITQTFVTRFNPLECGNMCPKSQSSTRLSEIRGAFGWNFLLQDTYHLGFNIQTSIPTGNKSNHGGLFDAQNGNDHHWELGGAITGHYTFWQSEDEERAWSINLDANLTHLFWGSQVRCFDVCGKPLSRYMLVERLGTPVVDGLVGAANEALNTPVNPQTPNAQFQSEFAPLANVTSFNVDVSVGVQADIVLWFNHVNGPWSFDLGYNLYARSCEKIKLDCECEDSQFAENTWAFKGDAWVWGYMGDNDGTSPILRQDDPVALSATMSQATINGGKNLGSGGTTTTNFSDPNSDLSKAHVNPNVDNPLFAYAGNNPPNPKVRLDIDTTFGRQIKTSVQPVFIQQSDVNFARIKTISNKIFAHWGYTCPDKEKYTPYWGLGFEAEWANGNGSNCGDCDDECESDCSDSCSDDCDSDCDNSTSGQCVKSGVSQWGVWARFGVNFQ